MARKSLQQRFEEKYIVHDNGCWLWSGACNVQGYGVISENRKAVLAHRASYELHVGEIPDDLCVLHHCDVPGCVRPDHLWLGTKADNSRDMANKGRHADFKGERHPQAKLVADQVREIRSAVGLQKTIAAQYGIARNHVSTIRSRKTWRHLL